MKKKTWIIVFVVIIIAIIVLLYFAFKKPDQKKSEKCPDGKTPIPANGKCPQESIGTNAVADPVTGCKQPSSYSNYQYPLEKGMKNFVVWKEGDDANVQGRAITLLQHKLNIKYKAGLGLDNYFGCKTENAVKEYLGTTKIYTTNSIWNTPEPILG